MLGFQLESVTIKFKKIAFEFIFLKSQSMLQVSVSLLTISLKRDICTMFECDWIGDCLQE